MSTSSSFDSAQQSYNSAQSTVHTISIGIIVAIVIIVLSIIASIITAFCLWNRNKKRRAARNAAYDSMNTGGYQYGNGVSNNDSSNNNKVPPMTSPSLHEEQPELHGSTVASRYEAPNTVVSYPEAPNNEVLPQKSYDNGHAELGGSHAGRSELQA